MKMFFFYLTVFNVKYIVILFDYKCLLKSFSAMLLEWLLFNNEIFIRGLAVIERKQRLKYFINETDIIYFKKCFICVTGIFVTKLNGGDTFLFIYPLDHSDANTGDCCAPHLLVAIFLRKFSKMIFSLLKKKIHQSCFPTKIYCPKN
jgi:hypothetical protein